MPEIRYLDAINQAHHEEMARDERVVVLGEDVGRKGGVFGATTGLLDKFGEERVIDTPLAESSIAGVAVGMAVNGLLPIAEFQFASKDPGRLPDCCSMLGICFREKGMAPLAVKWYRKGLDALAGGGDEDRLNGVRFDLADVLEQMGEYRQALDLFMEVYGTDSRYRDVSARIQELEKRLSR